MPAHRARVKIVAYHYGRLAILFGVLALLIGFGVVDPYALTVGLSVVVINLLLTTVLDAEKMEIGGIAKVMKHPILLLDPHALGLPHFCGRITWLLMICLLVLGLYIRSRLRMEPGKFQVLLETVIGGMYNFFPRCARA